MYSEKSSSEQSECSIITTGSDNTLNYNINNRHNYSMPEAMLRVKIIGESSTNQIKGMHEGLQKGKYSLLRNDNKKIQELEIEMLSNKELDERGIDTSMHKLNSVKEIKYYAEINNGMMKCDEYVVVNHINVELVTEYHLNKLGKIRKNGNQLNFIGFFTEQGQNHFLTNSSIQKNVRKFYALDWMDKINTNQIIIFTNIEIDYNTKLFVKAIEDKIGKVIKTIRSWGYQGKVCKSMEVFVTCLKQQLEDTWGIIVEGNCIKVKPRSIPNHLIKNRVQ